MSECQSKCACGDICRRVDEHLQHQCPKCNYEQRWTAENVAAAPATPAATPMAALIAKWRRNADDIRLNGHISATYGTCADELDELLQPAAAQPQRESEQPEQALREALQKFSDDLDAMRSTMPRSALQAMDYFRRSLDDILERAALSPQTDSQETL